MSDAINRRSPEIFRAMFEEILNRALACAPGHNFKFKNPLHVIDSTTIALSLTVYSWAHYRKQKGAIKLHTELDLSGNLPCYVLMTNGRMSERRRKMSQSNRTASSSSAKERRDLGRTHRIYRRSLGQKKRANSSSSNSWTMREKRISS
jgi:hypothetical protein